MSSFLFAVPQSGLSLWICLVLWEIGARRPGMTAWANIDLPTVGVLLATYDGADYCEDQLVSLLWQRGVDVHIYVRDDGSRDETLAIVRRLSNEHPGRITILDNRGVLTGSPCGNFFALLTQVALARHSHIAFADQDDVWMPDKLAHAVASMTANNAVGYSSDLIAYNQGQNAAWILRKKGEAADLDYLFQGGSAGCTYVLSIEAAQLIATVISNVPSLYPGASHDWIIYAICRSRGLKWFCDRSAGIIYRQHAANQYGAQRGWSNIVAKYRLTRSGWYRGHILWMRNVVVNSDDERRVLAAVERGTVTDRWWLLRQASRFRRTSQSVLHLRVAILMGKI